MTSSPIPAQDLLKQFDCTGTPTIPTEERAAVKTALCEVVTGSDFLTLGVCAERDTAGFEALSAYLDAFGLTAEALPEESAIAGPIYIKYNTQSGKHYTSDYPGNARGVLVCCHQYEPDLTSDMYGHLPLDLFSAD